MEFPMESFARFYSNHGLLSVWDHPTWYYIPGGSRTYVKAFLEGFTGRVRPNCPVTAVRRTDRGVALKLADGAEDGVAAGATHPEPEHGGGADQEQEDQDHHQRRADEEQRPGDGRGEHGGDDRAEAARDRLLGGDALQGPLAAVDRAQGQAGEDAAEHVAGQGAHDGAEPQAAERAQDLLVLVGTERPGDRDPAQQAVRLRVGQTGDGHHGHRDQSDQHSPQHPYRPVSGGGPPPMPAVTVARDGRVGERRRSHDRQYAVRC